MTVSATHKNSSLNYDVIVACKKRSSYRNSFMYRCGSGTRCFCQDYETGFCKLVQVLQRGQQVKVLTDLHNLTKQWHLKGRGIVPPLSSPTARAVQPCGELEVKGHLGRASPNSSNRHLKIGN